MKESYPDIFKMLVVGPGEVGKTSIIKCLADKEAEVHLGIYHPTAGPDFSTKDYQYDDGSCRKQFKFQIWEVGGKNNRFDTLARGYYRGSKGIAIVVNSSLPVSEQLDSIKKYHAEIVSVVPDLPIFIIANQKEPLVYHALKETELSEFCNVQYFPLSVAEMLKNSSIKEMLLHNFVKSHLQKIEEKRPLSTSAPSTSAEMVQVYPYNSRWWCCFIPCCKPEASSNRENEPLLHGPRRTS